MRKSLARLIVSIILGIIFGGIIHLYILPKAGIAITKWLVIAITSFIIWLIMKPKK